MKKSMYCVPLLLAGVCLLVFNFAAFASTIDARIESSAMDSYIFKTYLKDDAINIASEDGAVTLTGTVNEEFHIGLAKETVASLPGVKSVDNQLKLEGEAPAETSDAWLITKVKSALLFHRNVSAIDTEVSAENGNVTLKGEATSVAQKDLTTEYVKGVKGVNQVNNEMTVLPVVMKSGEKMMGKKMIDEKTMGEKVDTVIESIDDASITTMVKTTLLYHRSTSGLNTTVETKNGVVKLGGKAGNAAEKDLATKLVSGVHGVKKVINNMTV